MTWKSICVDCVLFKNIFQPVSSMIYDSSKYPMSLNLMKSSAFTYLYLCNGKLWSTISIFYILLNLNLEPDQPLYCFSNWCLSNLEPIDQHFVFYRLSQFDFFCEINIYFSTCILIIPKIKTTEGANCVYLLDDESWIQVNHGGA